MALLYQSQAWDSDYMLERAPMLVRGWRAQDPAVGSAWFGKDPSR